MSDTRSLLEGGKGCAFDGGPWRGFQESWPSSQPGGVVSRVICLVMSNYTNLLREMFCICV